MANTSPALDIVDGAGRVVLSLTADAKLKFWYDQQGNAVNPPTEIVASTIPSILSEVVQLQNRVAALEALLLSNRVAAIESFIAANFTDGAELTLKKRIIPTQGLRQPHDDGLFIYDNDATGVSKDHLSIRNHGAASTIYSRSGNGTFDQVRINKRTDINDASEGLH